MTTKFKSSLKVIHTINTKYEDTNTKSILGVEIINQPKRIVFWLMICLSTKDIHALSILTKKISKNKLILLFCLIYEISFNLYWKLLSDPVGKKSGNLDKVVYF